MTTFEEKVFEVVCKFSTSFLQKEGSESQKYNQNDESLIELQPVLRVFADKLNEYVIIEKNSVKLIYF